MVRDKEYYYMDLNLETMQVLDVRPSKTATLTGDTDDPKVHRIFLTKGQYNKLKKKLG